MVVGHDVCSGSFGFDDGRAHRLAVELFDAAGNAASKPHNLELLPPATAQPVLPLAG